MIELVFPARGGFLPTDHGYALYGALSRIVPAFHDDDGPFRFAPVTGIGIPNGRLQLHEHSVLRVRTPEDRIRTLLPLAGKRLELDGETIRLGVPAVRTLAPAPSLVARLVTFKPPTKEGDAPDLSPDRFLELARKKLSETGVTGEAQLPIHLDGDRAGEPLRRVVRVKGAAIVGYSLLVAELSAADSLRLQETGLGGRTQMGCGFFVPTRKGGM
jgi:CRISPR-associated protein Cas6